MKGRRSFDLAITICIVYLTVSMLRYHYQEETIVNRIDSLNATMQQIKEDYKKLFDEQASIYGNLTNMSRQIKDLRTKISGLRKELRAEHKRNNELKNQLESVKKSKGLLKPTYKQLKSFVLRDDTDLLEWEEDFDCTEFSNRFIDNFAKEGFFACTTELNLIIDGEEAGHIIVAVNTKDKGLYYVEPQSDSVFPADELQVGKNYCSIVDWDCNWEITKISSCFELKL